MTLQRVSKRFRYQRQGVQDSEALVLRQRFHLQRLHVVSHVAYVDAQQHPLSDLNIQKESNLHMLTALWGLWGGKPVVLLYPTKKMKGIEVSLRLDPATWAFATLDPKPTGGDSNHTATWRLCASPDGILRLGRREVSSLFWEVSAGAVLSGV